MVGYLVGNPSFKFKFYLFLGVIINIWNHIWSLLSMLTVVMYDTLFCMLSYAKDVGHNDTSVQTGTLQVQRLAKPRINSVSLCRNHFFFWGFQDVTKIIVILNVVVKPPGLDLRGKVNTNIRQIDLGSQESPIIFLIHLISYFYYCSVCLSVRVFLHSCGIYLSLLGTTGWELGSCLIWKFKVAT